ncbi:hypothetical protein NHQ30_002345 [Ciborinia camelliae]|nr:hypothetical protein NHQ30_002345 [Ciborinia camelliae]
MISVADLVERLHSNIDEIHKTITLISDTSDHDAEIVRLEKERDEQLQQLKTAHEIAIKEGEEARLKREQEIEEEIKKEEEEIKEIRRREDEERKLRIENAVKEREKARQEEEEKRKAEFESRHKVVEDGVDEEMEKLEDELEKRMMHGQKALDGLDAARREINRQIDEQLNIPTVLPKIQYKSRKKTLLNVQESDLSSEDQNMKDVGKNGQDNPIKNEDSIRDMNEQKIEGPQDYGADVADNEKSLVLEQAKESRVELALPIAEKVIHQEQETQSSDTEHVEVASPPMDQTPALMPEEKHLELEEQQHPGQEPPLQSIAQEYQNQSEDVEQSVEDISREIHEVSGTSPTDTPPIPEDTAKDPAEENQSTHAGKNETSDNPKQDGSSEVLEIAKIHFEESQSVEVQAEDVNDKSKQYNTLVELPKEAGTFPAHVPHESVEDRVAREEIAKLNEKIRQAMEEEAAGSMMPHEEVNLISQAPQDDELTKREVPEISEVDTTLETTDQVSNDTGTVHDDLESTDKDVHSSLEKSSLQSESLSNDQSEADQSQRIHAKSVSAEDTAMVNSEQAGDMKSSSDKKFLRSGLTPEVAQTNFDTPENAENHLLPTNTQHTGEDNDIINEKAVPKQEELHVKDADIDSVTNATANSTFSHESEFPETRNVILDVIPKKAYVAIEPVQKVMRIPEQTQNFQEIVQATVEGSDANIREPEVPVNSNVVNDGRSNGEEALNSNPEYYPQTIDEPVQLPGHIKYRIDEPMATIQHENGDLLKTISEEEGITSETTNPDAENKHLKLDEAKIQPPFDKSNKGKFPIVEEVNTPDPEEFEGTGSAILTLDVGSPLPSPTLQEATGNQRESSYSRPDVVESSMDPNEMEQEEEPSEINHLKNSEIMDISQSSLSTMAISEDIHEASFSQEKEQPNGIEEDQINTAPKVKTTSQDTISQPQQEPNEDPEDVRAREEIAHLNAEFIKEEHYNGEVNENELVEEEQRRPSSLESVEDTAAREEIALLNEQMKFLTQQQGNGNRSAEVEGGKEENHELSGDSESETLEPEQLSVNLEDAKTERHQSEESGDEQDFYEIFNSTVQHDENRNTPDQSDEVVSGGKAISDEPSEEVEASQHEHRIHDPQDSSSEYGDTEEGEETESHSESENEWEGSIEDEEEPPFLETIQEESHDEAFSDIEEDHEDEDDEEMLKSGFFHPDWNNEDINDDDYPKGRISTEPTGMQDNKPHGLKFQGIATAEFSHNPQDDQDHVDLSVLFDIDQCEADQHSENSALQTEHAEQSPMVLEPECSTSKNPLLANHHDELEYPHEISLEVSKPRSTKQQQTPMQLVPNYSDDEETEWPLSANGTNELIDSEDWEAPIKTPNHSNGTNLPRLLEPSPVLYEMDPTPENSEQVEQKSLGQTNNLTTEAGSPRRPTSLYQRNSDLSPEHAAVFSRVSEIRNSLTPSPEPRKSSDVALSPKSPSEIFTPEEHRNYDASINNIYDDGWELPTISDDDQPQNDYRSQLNIDGGRNRSHTVDTAPSFEYYASEDGDSGPPTPPQQPQYYNPESEQPHIGQMLASEFQSSEGWSLPNNDTHEHSANQEQSDDEGIKSPIPQEAAEFDPFNPQEYKSPITSPAKSSFHVSNVHVDQEYPLTSSSNTSSLLPSETTLASNAPDSNSSSASQTPSTLGQAEKRPTSQLPPNLHSVPWTQTEDQYKAANQEKDNALPQRNPRPVSSIFSKTRSLFESAESSESNPLPKQRPLSAISRFHVAPPSRSTPPPPIQTLPHSPLVSSLRSAPSSKRLSLHPSESATGSINADYDPNTDADFLPKCLDGDGRLPSPSYGLPGHRSSGSLDKERHLHGDEDDPYYSQKGKASGSWMGGLAGTKSRGAMSEGEPLLRNGN